MRSSDRIDIEAVPSTSGLYSPDAPEPDFGYSPKAFVAPWVTKRYKLSIEGLHAEILDVYHWLRPTTLEFKLRMRVFEKVEAVIRQRWKDYEIRISVFGSLRTKLFLPTSDIDVLVECEHPDWKNSEYYLKETSEALRLSGLADKVNCYMEAFVPIVKMVDMDTKVSIDISFNTVQGVRAAHFIEQVKREFPVVEPLILILKQFLIQRNLNQTFMGGLSSYGLILMLISFLQIYALPIRDRNMYHEDVNLGELLMRFFEVYAQEFNYSQVGISVRDCRYIPRKHNPTQSAYLSIEDPLLTTNEVGRNTFNFEAVRVAFAEALQVLSGVFIRDRRKPTAISASYCGSMIGLIMPFSIKEVQYRNWLKGFNFSYSCAKQSGLPKLVFNTFLAPPLNLDDVNWIQKTRLTAPKPSKRLDIVHPSESKSDEIVRKSSNEDSGFRSNEFSPSDSQVDVFLKTTEPMENGEIILDIVSKTLPNGCARTPSPSENRTPSDQSRPSSHSGTESYSTIESKKNTHDKRPLHGVPGSPNNHQRQPNGYRIPNGTSCKTNNKSISPRTRNGYSSRISIDRNSDGFPRAMIVENSNLKPVSNRPPSIPIPTTNSRSQRSNGRVYYSSNGHRSSDGDSSDRDSIPSGTFARVVKQQLR